MKDHLSKRFMKLSTLIIALMLLVVFVVSDAGDVQAASAKTVKKLKLSASNVTLDLGSAKTRTVTAKVFASAKLPANNKLFRVSAGSSDKNIVSVSVKKPSGKKSTKKAGSVITLTAKKAGTAVITVKTKGKGKKNKPVTARITVTVKAAAAPATATETPAQTVENPPVNTPAATNVPTPAGPAAMTNESDLLKALADSKDKTDEVNVLFKTNDKLSVNIPEDKYPNTVLTIDAPNATVTNAATFKQVVIKSISENTFNECGDTNCIQVKASASHIVMLEGSRNAKVVVAPGAGRVNIENNGVGTSLARIDIETSAYVMLSGRNNTQCRVENKAADSTLTTSVQVVLLTQNNMNLQVLPGGQTSRVFLQDTVSVDITGVGVIEVTDKDNVTRDVTASELKDDSLTISENSVLSGIVLDQNNDPVKEADVTLYTYIKDEQEALAAKPVYTAKTGDDGIYSISNVRHGNYYAVYKSGDLRPCTALVYVYDSKVELGNIVLVEDTDEKGTLSGILIDSVSGESVKTAGVKLLLRKGSNNISGPVVADATTDSDGFYKFEDLEAGMYTAQVTDNRAESEKLYVRTYAVFTVIGGKDIAGNITVNLQNVFKPEEITGGEGQLKFILRWYPESDDGSVPKDLDSHLIGPKVRKTGQFHVYFEDQDYDETIGDETVNCVNLDVDDIDFEGPETTAVYRSSNGIYHFYVYDYTNQTKEDNKYLSTSGATVEVQKGDKSLATYSVPVGKIGTLWDVCTYDMTTNTLTPINNVYYHPGDSVSVGKSLQEMLREKAFSVQKVSEEENELDFKTREVEQDDGTNRYEIRITGEAGKLTDPVFTTAQSDAVITYREVQGQDYSGILKVEYDGVFREFYVYYTRVTNAFDDVKISWPGTDLDQRTYSVYLDETFDEDEENIVSSSYRLNLEGEDDFSNDIEFSFINKEGVECSFTPATGKEYKGILHAEYEEFQRDIEVYYSKITYAFDEITVSSNTIPYGEYTAYTDYRSDYDEDEDEYSDMYYYITIEAEENQLASPVFTFDNREGVSATYEAVTGQPYAGIIHAAYKDFKRDIRVYCNIKTNAFDEITVSSNSIPDGEYTAYTDYRSDYDEDEDEYSDMYYYITIEAEENQLASPVFTFDNREGVSATYEAVTGQPHAGIIHAAYKDFKRDIRVYCNVVSYTAAFDEVIVSSSSIPDVYEGKYTAQLQQETNYDEEKGEYVYRYYINVEGDAEILSDPSFEFTKKEGVTYEYKPVEDEDYAGLIVARYKGYEREIYVYYRSNSLISFE